VHQQGDATLQQYSVPVISMLAMLLRPWGEYKLYLTDTLKLALDRLRETLPPQDTSLGDGALAVLDVLMALWTVKWLPSASGRLQDPTICYLALSMLNADGSLADAKYTTGPIAKLEYCMRLAFLAEMRRLTNADSSLDDEAAFNLLQPWFTEKVDSTFNSLRSLTHRASAIAHTTMSLPRIWWLDRVTWQSMLYMGHTVKFSDIRQVFAALESKAVDLWEKSVLCGLDLRVEYSDLSEDLTEKAVGYSFLTDPRNTCFRHQQDRLMAAILADDGLRGRFVTLGDSAAGKTTWNKPNLRSWLYDYARFNGLQLARAETLTGSPSRGTELTSMARCNTTTRDSNLALLGKHVCLLVEYHKSSGLTGSDKLIPHALDALTADLLIQDLALARPFAQMAAHICFPGNHEVRRLYEEQLFVNVAKPFDTNALSCIMGDISLPIVGMALKVNPWRHINIAFTRKLCGSINDLLADDLQTVEAAQASHTRQLEERIYGLSKDSLAGVAEDVLPLYLDCSTRWQVQCRVVPGGLALPYRKARSAHFNDLVRSGHIACGPDPVQPSFDADSFAKKVVTGMQPALEQALAGPITSMIENSVATMVETSVARAMASIGECLDE
jgi:hypothetical protein